MAAVRGAEPSVERSVADRRAAACMAGLIQPSRECGLVSFAKMRDYRIAEGLFESAFEACRRLSSEDQQLLLRKTEKQWSRRVPGLLSTTSAFPSVFLICCCLSAAPAASQYSQLSAALPRGQQFLTFDTCRPPRLDLRPTGSTCARTYWRRRCRIQTKLRSGSVEEMRCPYWASLACRRRWRAQPPPPSVV